MDRQTAIQMHKGAIGALERWADSNGYKVKSGRTTYDRAGTISFKIEIAEGNEVFEALNASLARMYGLPADVVGRIFTSRGTEYQITGINERAHKFPIQAKRVSDGRGYKFPVRAVQSVLT